MNAPAKDLRSDAEKALVAEFGQRRTSLPGSATVDARRVESFETFAARGLPTRRVEAWHYTDLRAAMARAFPAAEPGASVDVDALAPKLEGLATHRLVIVDGQFVPELSATTLPAGLSVRSLDTALSVADGSLVDAIAPPGLGSADAAIALNAALMQGGVVIDIAAAATVESTIELVFVSSGARESSVTTRSLVRVGQCARVSLFERHVAAGAAARQLNDALVIAIGDEAQVDHVVFAPSVPPNSVSVATFLATLGARARLASFALVAESGFARRQLFVRFDGPNASISLDGVALLANRDHADTTLVVEHVAPHCQSRERFKHIVDGRASGVFQGRIVVAPGAQKTDGGMSSRAILLAEDASMYNKPELEIFADDVVCGHGATCGELDEDQLFYAMQRGLPRTDAEALLLEAFAGDVADSIGNEIIRDAVMERVRARLAARRHA